MSDERARLFVALELPDDVREGLGGWREDAVEGGPRLRLIARKYLHVTLCFLGWQSLVEVGRIRDACSAVAGMGAARLALSGAIWLPPRRPRVLAVELDDPEGALGRIQAVLSEALEAGGWYVPEKRRYLPHVTVARVPAGVRVRAEPLLAPPRIEFAGAELTLYRSHLARAGAEYEAMHGVALAGQI